MQDIELGQASQDLVGTKRRSTGTQEARVLIKREVVVRLGVAQRWQQRGLDTGSQGTEPRRCGWAERANRGRRTLIASKVQEDANPSSSDPLRHVLIGLQNRNRIGTLGAGRTTFRNFSATQAITQSVKRHPLLVAVFRSVGKDGTGPLRVRSE